MDDVDRIVAGLITPFGQGAPWLYVLGDANGKPIWNQWFMTGPVDRTNYVKGPFPKALVDNMVRRGLLEIEVEKDGRAHAYRLRVRARLSEGQT